jgi:hypothetical protein
LMSFPDTCGGSVRMTTLSGPAEECKRCHGPKNRLSLGEGTSFRGAKGDDGLCGST